MVHDGDRLRPDLTYQPGETPIIASEIEPDKPLVAVAFNGCIYNHRELRKELEAVGHVFETDHSDTEVLVHGWHAWTQDFPSHLDSMSSVSLWDNTTATFLLTRDEAGEKPLSELNLVISDVDIAYSFSSSASSLIKLSRFAKSRAQPIHHTLTQWIAQGSNELSPVSERSLICPGEVAELSVGNDSSCWDIDTVKLNSRGQSTRHFRTNDNFSTHDFLQRVEVSVHSRLEADVPLGVFLSGGIDSALISSIAHNQRPGIKTFTVRMPDKRYDESEAAQETAQVIGTDHTTLDCDPNPASDLILLIEQLGLPFGDSSLLPTYWVSKAAREHIKVALSGDGGDELFGGYRRHTIAPMLNRWHHLLKFTPTSLLDQRQPGSKATYLTRLAHAARFGGYSELLAIFPTPDLRKLVHSINGEPVGNDTFHKITDPLRHDFTHYLPDDLLRKTDTASMANALEVRCPFLDPDLAQAALATPKDILMPNGERKGLLKQVARKYLPDHIVDRPKQGFAIPIGEWFRTDYGDMRQLLLDHLRSSDPFPGLEEAGVKINMKFVERMIREHDAAGEKSINPWHGRDHSQRLYMLLVLSIWSKWLHRIQSGNQT